MHVRGRYGHFARAVEVDRANKYLRSHALLPSKDRPLVNLEPVRGVRRNARHSSHRACGSADELPAGVGLDQLKSGAAVGDDHGERRIKITDVPQEWPDRTRDIHLCRAVGVARISSGYRAGYSQS